MPPKTTKERTKIINQFIRDVTKVGSLPKSAIEKFLETFERESYQEGWSNGYDFGHAAGSCQTPKDFK